MEISRHLREVEDEGYTLLEQPFGTELIDALERDVLRIEREMGSKLGKNRFHGHKSVRVKGLINRGASFEQLVIHPAMLAAVEGLLGRDVQLAEADVVFAEQLDRLAHAAPTVAEAVRRGQAELGVARRELQNPGAGRRGRCGGIGGIARRDGAPRPRNSVDARRSRRWP